MSPPDDTKSRLLNAAGAVFAEKGFEAATVREICQAAGANIAAVNYYFGDKERLYIEAVREAYCAREENAPMPLWTEGTPPETKLHDFVATFLRRLLAEGRPPWHLGLALRELAHPTAACVEIVRDYIRPMAEILRAIVAELAPADADSVDRHLLCFSIVGQCLFYHVHKAIIRELVGEEEFATYHVDLLADHVTGFTLAALGLGRAPSPESSESRR